MGKIRKWFRRKIDKILEKSFQRQADRLFDKHNVVRTKDDDWDNNF